MSTVLVAGASGTLGRRVVSAAREQGFKVRALGRLRSSLESLGADEIALAEPVVGAGLDEAMAGVETVISALGASVSPEFGKGYRGFEAVDRPANLALIRAAERARVRRFVYVSMAGHREGAHLAYVRAHEAVVQALAASKLDHAVLRPTGFFAAFGAMVEMAAKGPLPILGDPEVKTNPIDEADLAERCIELARQPELAGADIELGGPEIFSRRQIAELAFHVHGRPSKLRRLPNWVVSTMAFLMRPLNPRVSDLLRFVLSVSNRDCVAPSYGNRRLEDYFARLVRTSPLRISG
ncbi:MAG TPA: NAD(P)H-binding protein [Polyangiaceae bacterium]|nr:NAD(P)H-binding protein [Polyangiaceae bacterium]